MGQNFVSFGIDEIILARLCSLLEHKGTTSIEVVVLVGHVMNEICAKLPAKKNKRRVFVSFRVREI